jgi:hypothetical protein
MKRVVTTPKGHTYMSVWRENGQLKMELQTGYVINLDEKTIPQLRSILEDMELEMAPTPPWRSQRETAPKTSVGEAW